MYYLIDIGSKSVKVYQMLNGIVTQIDKESYKLNSIYKENFAESMNSSVGLELSADDKELLFCKFNDLAQKYVFNKSNTKIFATGHFRDITDKHAFIVEFYARTGLYFNIISQDLEAHYMAPILNRYKDVLGNTILINIGGGSIELLFCRNGKLYGKPQKLNFGANRISEIDFPHINQSSEVALLNDIVTSVQDKLQSQVERYQSVIYTGGELSFMKLLGYPLKENILFVDQAHPLTISTEDYYAYNEKLFSEYTIEDLHDLMPSNPTWMDGARACSAIAQAICQKFGVETIIPSDLNLIDGVCIQEARNAVICGSFNKHLSQIDSLIKILREKGINVLSPKNTDVVDNLSGFVVLKGDKMINNCKWSVETNHLKAIEDCDMVIICNYDNFIGVSTAIEIGYSMKCGKKIVFLENNEIAQSMDAPFEIGLLTEVAFG